MRVEGATLYVEASGFDETLEEAQAYAGAVIQRALAGGCTRVLCDERKLQYRLSTFDTYELAARTAQAVPSLARVALVCAPECFADATFYENVAVNRGLSVCAFKDLDRARAWLEQPARG